MKTEYNTTELQETFKVLGFSHGFCAVEHKETKERGSLDFEYRRVKNAPNLQMRNESVKTERIYFNYQKSE